MWSPPNLSCCVCGCPIEEFLVFRSLSFLLFLLNCMIRKKCFPKLFMEFVGYNRKESLGGGQLFWIFIFWHPLALYWIFKKHFTKVRVTLGALRFSNIIILWRRKRTMTIGPKWNVVRSGIQSGKVNEQSVASKHMIFLGFMTLGKLLNCTLSVSS